MSLATVQRAYASRQYTYLYGELCFTYQQTRQRPSDHQQNRPMILSRNECVFLLSVVVAHGDLLASGDCIESTL
jgi:hypothetical protein